MAYSLLSFSASAEEKTIIKSIAAKHAPEEHNYEVMPIIEMIEDIFHNSLFKAAKVPEIHRLHTTSSSPAKKVDWLENIHCTINYLSCKISCDCKKDLDVQPIFDLLEKFSWEVKVVLVLAAFAMTYGEFWLNISVTENPVLQLVSALKQPQWLHGSTIPEKFPLQALANLVKSTLELADRLIRLKQYCAEFQTQFEIQVACYRIIKSVVLCHSYNLDLLKKGTGYTASTTEIQTLETYTGEIQKISVFLNEQLEKFFIIEGEKAFSTSTDITICIQNFFAITDSLPLWHASRTGDNITFSKVGVDLFKGLSVALFISEIDFDVNLPEFNILVKTYKKIKEDKSKKGFEIIWIPMVDKFIQWSEIKGIIYDRAAKMPWDLFCDPTTIKISLISYVRKSWHFQKKPILTILDSKGNVSCTNAIPMVTVWGDLAYPFTSSTEAELWKGMSWNVQTMVEHVEGIDASKVINQEKLVCFYGGDDLDWIRKFAQKIKQTGVPIELIYIGMNGRRDKLQKILAALAKESISKYWTEETIISFWFRFQCMFNFRMQHCKSTELMQDSILKELMTILTYDSTDHGWAMIFKGSHDIVKASGKQLTEILEHFQEWGPSVHDPGEFLVVINGQITNSQSYVHCAHTMVPMTGWFNPGNMSCFICGRPMERYYLYKCCIEEDKKENGFSFGEEEDGF